MANIAGKSRKKRTVILSSVMAFLLIAALVVNILAVTVFGEFLTRWFGSYSSYETSGLYDTGDYTPETLRAEEQAYSAQVAGEGSVLLKYDEDSALPYAAGTTFSLFGRASTKWMSSGTGSGGGNANGSAMTGDGTLRSVFEENGFHVNEQLWNFYANRTDNTGSGSYDYGSDEDYTIDEAPAGDLVQFESSFAGTSAVFVIGRTGGEGRDLARGMYQHTDIEEDKSKHYLELNSVELGIVEYLNSRFDDITVIVNTNNPFELGWVEEYENINAVLFVPGTGADGIAAVGKIFSGEVNPSGHLVDTFAFDALSSPAAQNCDEFLYYPEGEAPAAADTTDLYYYYITYAEGIYVGYKYYETRYEDYVLGQGNAGEYDYAATVQYPFGYGLSYTQFSYSQPSIVYDSSADEYTVTLTVTNTGDVAGKDAVQLYAQTPYTEYDVQHGLEKSAVQLVGFAKTEEIAAGGSQEVSIRFDRADLASYDDTLMIDGSEEEGGYLLEAGQYYIAVASDAHAAVNHILAAKGADTERMAGEGDASLVLDDIVVEEDDTSYSFTTQSDGTVTRISNKLQLADRRNDGSEGAEDFQYLTRSDWIGSFPVPDGAVSATVSEYGNAITESNVGGYVYYRDLSRENYNKIRSTESNNPIPDSEYDSMTIAFGTGAEANTFYQMRGLDYDDEAWDAILSRITYSKLTQLIVNAGYGTTVVNDIGKPSTSESDGPSGWRSNATSAGYTFPCGLMLAQTWNAPLAKMQGTYMGLEYQVGLVEYTAWYGPAMNIHRTPFSGRNFEYFSEDAFLSGAMGREMATGASEQGITPCIKHFAFNDNENHRGDRSNDLDTGNGSVGDFGICVWTNEQAAREIYLKPFDMTLNADPITMRYQDTNGDIVTREIAPCNGIMTSFNRIGYTWAGGEYNLITGIVREEWGFDGYIVTDMDKGSYMDTEQMLRAGGDAKLNNLETEGKQDYNGELFVVNANSSNAIKYYAKQAVHHMLYAQTNSGITNRVENFGIPVYGVWLLMIDGAVLIGEGVLAFFLIRGIRKDRKANETGAL